MTQSLTDWLQHTRLVVVDVDKDRSRVRVKGVADACSDLSCTQATLVIGDDGPSAHLGTLNPGDIVRVEGAPGRADRIVVVRRVWEELTSPEF